MMNLKGYLASAESSVSESLDRKTRFTVAAAAAADHIAQVHFTIVEFERPTSPMCFFTYYCL